MRIHAFIAAMLFGAGLGAFALVVLFEFLAAGYEKASQTASRASQQFQTVQKLKQNSADLVVSLDLATGGFAAVFLMSDRLLERCEADIKALQDSKFSELEPLVDRLQNALKEIIRHAQILASLKPESEESLKRLANYDRLTQRYWETLDKLQESALQTAEQQRKSLQQRSQVLYGATAIAGFVYIAMVGGLWKWAARRLIRPMVQLTNNVSQSGSARSIREISDDAPKELQQLAVAFSSLLSDRDQQHDNLEGEMELRIQTEQALRKSETEKRMALESMQEAQAQLRQHQKLEALGTLAGGVAHEINNPVNGIMNYAQVISDQLPPKSPLHSFVSEINKESSRVAEIVKNLLTFARQDQSTHSPVQVVDIINQTTSLIQTIIRRDQISLEVNVPNQPLEIKCQSQQIQQVLMNLLTNARDALNERFPEHHPDKIIRLSASEYKKDNRSWIQISVEDRGVGIPEKLRDRVFDPFFTTKPLNQGTGLGLSISHGIARDHQGDLTFESHVGKGTEFLLKLPVKPLPFAR